MTTSSPPNEGFACFAWWLGLSPAQTQTWYDALVACGSHQAKRTLYRLERFAGRRSQEGMLRELVRFGCAPDSPGHPHRLMALVEMLVVGGWLSRQEAIPLENAIDARMRKDGMWR